MSLIVRAFNITWHKDSKIKSMFAYKDLPTEVIWNINERKFFLPSQITIWAAEMLVDEYGYQAITFDYEWVD